MSKGPKIFEEDKKLNINFDIPKLKLLKVKLE